jgi:hypothetical protein
MHDAHAFFDRFEQIERSKAIIAMGMKLQRNVADVLLNEPHQITGAIWSQHTADILET